ncbi:hypothetical protein AAC387_Pa02g2457 [Persea americana]
MRRLKPIEPDGHEAGAEKDLENGVIGGVGVVEAVLAASLVEELGAGKISAQERRWARTRRMKDREICEGQGGVDGGCGVGR